MEAPAGGPTFWRDSQGRVVVGQAPNLPIAGWLLFAILAWTSSGHWRSGASFISSAFLFTWAYLELRHGVNHFRRLMGLAVLAVVVGSHFR